MRVSKITEDLLPGLICNNEFGFRVGATVDKETLY